MIIISVINQIKKDWDGIDKYDGIFQFLFGETKECMVTKRIEQSMIIHIVYSLAYLLESLL